MNFSTNPVWSSGWYTDLSPRRSQFESEWTQNFIAIFSFLFLCFLAIFDPLSEIIGVKMLYILIKTNVSLYISLKIGMLLQRTILPHCALQWYSRQYNRLTNFCLICVMYTVGRLNLNTPILFWVVTMPQKRVMWQWNGNFVGFQNLYNF